MENRNDVVSTLRHEQNHGSFLQQGTEEEDATFVSAISDDGTSRRLTETHQSALFEKSLPLCGRTKERNQLLAALKNATSTKGTTTQAVIVRGASGCGKSALVDKTFRSVFEDGTTTKGWFVTGKFDQYNGRNDPFSAIIAAITDLIDLIEHMGVVHLYEDDVREAIKGNETAFACIIPNLGSITNRQYEITSLRPQHTMMFRQFISTFRTLLSALSRREYPLVVFLDDLQWMDDATFELLQALITPDDTSSSTSHLLLIGAIRSDDQWTQTILNRLNHGMRMECRNSELIMYIDVGAVDQDTVTDMISARLGLAHGSCKCLGSMVFQKTRGSPFAVLRFLDLVASKGLLVYKENSWVWDESKIMSDTNISSNVLELVQQNMKRLPKQLTDILAIAAFLGYEFKRDTLIGLVQCGDLEMIATPAVTESELMALLNRACKEGFLEKTTQRRDAGRDFKFSHDKVQQAFYISAADCHAQNLHRAIGLYLWNDVGEKAAIEVADHLNRTGPCFVSKAILLDVNFAAAKLARSRRAYPLSAKYLRHAWSHLGSEKWTKQYDRSLEMSVFLLELCFACGDSAEVDSIVAEVSEHGRCLEDKLPVMYGKVCFLGSSCRYQEAIAYAIFVVRLCGQTIPKNPNLLQILLLLSVVRRRALRLTDDDIVGLPTVVNKKAEYLLLLYSRIATYAIMMEQDTLQFFCALRAAQLSLVEGVSTATPTALALLGTAEAATGNFKAAARFGRLVTRLVEEREMGPEATAQSYSLATCLVLHWSESIDGDFSSIVKKGMEVGILGGEFEWGFFSATLHFSLELACGVPLCIVEQHARETCLKMKEFKVEGVAGMAKVFWQSVLNLLGESEYPTVLTGEAMNETEHMNDPTIKASCTQRLVLTYQKFNLARLHGSNELAKQLSATLNKRFKDYRLKTSFHLVEIKLNQALLWYHMARESVSKRHKQRYLSKARAEVKFMKEMRQKGCPNFENALHILEAEAASCVEDKSAGHVQSLYDAAITRVSGRLHHEAMALEQAALFLIGRDDVATGATYMQRAVSKYLEWNAYAKASDLVDKYSHLAGFLPTNDAIGNMTLCLPASSIDSDEFGRTEPSQHQLMAIQMQ